MKNYSEIIKSKENRSLTAKGNKFVWKCIDIVAGSKGLNKYSSELKETKEKLKNILDHLIIDKEMSIAEIVYLIKSNKLLN